MSFSLSLATCARVSALSLSLSLSLSPLRLASPSLHSCLIPSLLFEY